MLVLIAGAGLRFVVVNPVRNYQLDFRAYYAAGRALRVGINPYDSLAVRAHVELPGEQSIMPYLYPPPSLLIAYGFSFLPYPAAQVPWACFNTGWASGRCCCYGGRRAACLVRRRWFCWLSRFY